MNVGKIEDQEFYRKHTERRDGFIAQAKAVMGDISLDELWKMYGDACVCNEDYLDELIECQEVLSSIELGVNLLHGKLEAIDNGHKLELMKMLAMSKNLIAEALIKGAEISKEVIAKKGARVRYANDAKQVALKSVRMNWEQWRATGFDKSQYKNKTAFAKDMIDAYPALVDHLTITRKMTEWERESNGEKIV